VGQLCEYEKQLHHQQFNSSQTSQSDCLSVDSSKSLRAQPEHGVIKMLKLDKSPIDACADKQLQSPLVQHQPRVVLRKKTFVFQTNEPNSSISVNSKSYLGMQQQPILLPSPSQAFSNFHLNSPTTVMHPLLASSTADGQTHAQAQTQTPTASNDVYRFKYVPKSHTSYSLGEFGKRSSNDEDKQASSPSSQPITTSKPYSSLGGVVMRRPTHLLMSTFNSMSETSSPSNGPLFNTVISSNSNSNNNKNKSILITNSFSLKRPSSIMFNSDENVHLMDHCSTSSAMTTSLTNNDPTRAIKTQQKQECPTLNQAAKIMNLELNKHNVCVNLNTLAPLTRTLSNNSASSTYSGSSCSSSSSNCSCCFQNATLRSQQVGSSSMSMSHQAGASITSVTASATTYNSAQLCENCSLTASLMQQQSELESSTSDESHQKKMKLSPIQDNTSIINTIISMNGSNSATKNTQLMSEPLKLVKSSDEVDSTSSGNCLVDLSFFNDENVNFNMRNTKSVNAHSSQQQQQQQPPMPQLSLLSSSSSVANSTSSLTPTSLTTLPNLINSFNSRLNESKSFDQLKLCKNLITRKRLNKSKDNLTSFDDEAGTCSDGENNNKYDENNEDNHNSVSASASFNSSNLIKSNNSNNNNNNSKSSSSSKNGSTKNSLHGSIETMIEVS
jgi:hypothetical protein